VEYVAKWSKLALITLGILTRQDHVKGAAREGVKVYARCAGGARFERLS